MDKPIAKSGASQFYTHEEVAAWLAKHPEAKIVNYDGTPYVAPAGAAPALPPTTGSTQSGTGSAYKQREGSSIAEVAEGIAGQRAAAGHENAMAALSVEESTDEALKKAAEIARLKAIVAREAGAASGAGEDPEAKRLRDAVRDGLKKK